MSGTVRGRRARGLILAAAAIVLCAASASAAPATNALPAGTALRDPFWPVGFTPQQPGEPSKPQVYSVSDAEWQAARKLLAVRGISRQRDAAGGVSYAALVNGRMLQVGETIAVRSNGRLFQWRVSAITLENGPEFERVTGTAPGGATGPGTTPGTGKGG